MEDLGAAAAARPRCRRSLGGRRRPALCWACSSRRASTAPTSPSARVRRWATTSASAVPTSASWRLRGAPASPAGPHRRRDHRHRRQPRLRAHAADPRAAHPPREGDLQHLLQPCPERAGGASSTCAGWARRACPSWPALRSQGRLPARTATALAGVEPLPDGPVFREFASALAGAGRARLVEALVPQGYLAGVDVGRWHPGLEDVLLVAVTERRTRASSTPSSMPWRLTWPAKRSGRPAKRSGPPARGSGVAETIFERSRPGAAGLLAAGL